MSESAQATGKASTRSAIVDELAEILPAIKAAVAEAEQAVAAAAALEAALERARQARADYDLAHAEANRVIEAVGGLPQGAFVAADLARIRLEHLDAADKLAGAEPADFPSAMQLLQGVAPACEVPRQVAEAHAAHLIELEQANARAAMLIDPSIAPDRLAIETDLIGAASTAAAARQHDAAHALLDQVADRCRAAQAVVATAAKLREAVAEARLAVALLTEPLVEPERVAGIRDLDLAEAAIAARTFDAVGGLIGQAKAACLKAGEIRVRHATYEQGVLAANGRLGEIPEPVVEIERTAIINELIAKAGEAATAREYDRADGLLAQVGGRVDLAKAIVAKSVLWAAALKTLVDRVALITAPVVSTDVATIKTTLIEPAKLLAALPGRAFDAAIAKIGPGAKACDVAGLRARRYAAALAVAEPQYNELEPRASSWVPDPGWLGWGAVPILGCTDILPDIKTTNLDGSVSSAAGGDFAAAMRALELATTRMGAADAALGQFVEWKVRTNVALSTHYSAYNATKFNQAQVLYDQLEADTFEQAAIAAKTGDYGTANARLDAWDKAFPPLNAAVVALEQGYDDNEALKGGSVDAVVQAVSDDVVGPGIALVQGADSTGGLRSGERAIALVPMVEAYRDALDAATADMAGPTPMAVPDRAQIQTDLIAAANTLALALNMPAATALLLKVPGEAAQARSAHAASEGAKTGATNAKQQVTTAGPVAALAQVKALLVPLTTHAEATAIALQIQAIETKILAGEQAIAVPDLPAAGTALTEAADLAPGAMLRAENSARLVAAREALRLRREAIDAAADPEKALVLTTYYNPSGAGIDLANIAPKLQLVAQGQATCAEAEEVARLSKLYDPALVDANNELAALSDAFLVPDHDKIQLDLIDKAATEATARRFQPALDFLKPVAAACALALEILAERNSFEAEMTNLVDPWNAANGYITSMTTPPAELTAEHRDIDLNVIVAADALVNGRTTGEPALAAVKAALKLVTDNIPRAEKLKMDAWCCHDIVADRLKAENKLSAIKLLDGHTAVATEIGQMDAQMLNGSTLFAAKAYSAAGILYYQLAAECDECTKLATLAASCALALKAATDRIAQCKLKVDALTPPPAALLQRFTAIGTETIAVAPKMIEARDFAAATTLLATVEARCVAAEALAADETLFVAALATAELAVGTLTASSALPEASRIGTAYIALAKSAAAGLDYKAANALLAKVAPACIAAQSVAGGETEATNALKAEGVALGGTLPDACAALERLLAPLLVHTAAASITDLTGPIGLTLAAARGSSPPPDAQDQVKQAAEECPPARIAAERHAEFARALLLAENAATALADPLVSEDRDAVRSGPITQAKAKAAPDTRDFAQASALLDKAMADCATAAALVERDVAFKLVLQKAQDALTAVGAPSTGPIAVVAAALQTDHIDAAKTKAAKPERKHDEAEALLAGFAAKCKSLALQMKMEGGTAPTEPEITAMLAEPGGAKMFDAMVAKLPDTAKREVINAAIQIRFGLTSFQNLDAVGAVKDVTAGKAKSLKQIYALLAMVPDTHTRDNDSFAEVERYGGDSSLPENVKRGSYFGQKKVVLSCGRAKDTDPQPLSGVALALPDVEPDCEMVPDSEVPPPKYFDWTTLHEVGHAIDDKKRFMSGKAGDAAFGGWVSHGRDVTPVAKAIGKACNYEGPAALSYLIATLAGGKPTAPANPSRVDWETCRAKAVAWCDEIRVDKELWENGGASSAHAVDGRIYHEAYENSWVSYDAAARTRGISGYQFRAPGEWLSELYAAYYCKKLKPTHPSAAWLATL